MSAIPVAAAADKIGTAAYNMGTQRVIGYNRSKTYVKGKKNPKTISESLNIGIQAWEIGALAVGGGILASGIGVYESLTGNSLSSLISSSLALNSSNPIEPLSVLGKPSKGVNPLGFLSNWKFPQV